MTSLQGKMLYSITKASGKFRFFSPRFNVKIFLLCSQVIVTVLDAVQDIDNLALSSVWLCLGFNKLYAIQKVLIHKCLLSDSNVWDSKMHN